MEKQTPPKTRTPNDQRSDVKNPNNPEHDAARDNRANQLNPNHAPTRGDGHPQRPSADPKSTEA